VFLFALFRVRDQLFTRNGHEIEHETTRKIIIQQSQNMNNIEQIVNQIVFEKNQEAVKILEKEAQKKDIWFDSTQKLYEAIALGKVSGFTVPAINIRTFTFDTACILFRLMKEKKVGASIFELARSEAKYTDQPMPEYATVVKAAAIAEGYKGPVFVQGDHFQIKAEKYFDPQKQGEELTALMELIRDSINAGVYNIDIDASTLVKLDSPDLRTQQIHNYKTTAEMTKFIRAIEPKGITVSVGGEIGEIGGKNSTQEEFRAFIKGYKALLPGGMKGIIKVSVQTGAAHGGIILPDGSRADIKLDLEVLQKISEEAKKYSLAGTVQHGASTLPEKYFSMFPEKKCIEVHLATAFQDIVYNHLSEELREKMYAYCRQNCAEERKPNDTDEQFLMKTRKKALGPFKKELWNLPEDIKSRIVEALEVKFTTTFEKLGVCGTKEIIERLYTH